MQRNTQMGYGGYSTVGQTGRAQKENHKKGDLRLRNSSSDEMSFMKLVFMRVASKFV